MEDRSVVGTDTVELCSFSFEDVFLDLRATDSATTTSAKYVPAFSSLGMTFESRLTSTLFVETFSRLFELEGSSTNSTARVSRANASAAASSTFFFGIDRDDPIIGMIL